MKLVNHQLFMLAICIFMWPYASSGSDCKVQQSGHVAWLETVRVPYQCQGQCTRLVGMFCTEDTSAVQLWSGLGSTRTLVWEKHWKPTKLGVLEYMDLEPSEYITAAPNQRLGIATTGDKKEPISVRILFNESFPQIVSSKTKGPFTRQESYEFDDILHPGSFVIDFCDASVCPELNVSPVSTTPAVECKLQPETDKVKLETKRPMMKGLVKAIKTHFCSPDPVKIQLWEPNEENPVDNYRLLWEKMVNPITTSGDETIIPLDPDEYILMEDTYRLGLQASGTGTVISVPYKFSSSGSANLITSADSAVTKCENSQFEGPPFPSEFLLSFCYDSGCQRTSSDAGSPLRTPCSNETYTTTETELPTSPTYTTTETELPTSPVTEVTSSKGSLGSSSRASSVHTLRASVTTRILCGGLVWIMSLYISTLRR